MTSPKPGIHYKKATVPESNNITHLTTTGDQFHRHSAFMLPENTINMHFFLYIWAPRM